VVTAAPLPHWSTMWNVVVWCGAVAARLTSACHSSTLSIAISARISAA
jgi:hypothetical protein